MDDRRRVARPSRVPLVRCGKLAAPGPDPRHPGRDPGDQQVARHADVVVQDGWAALFYFTHPNTDTDHTADMTTAPRSVVHWARLAVVDKEAEVRARCGRAAAYGSVGRTPPPPAFGWSPFPLRGGGAPHRRRLPLSGAELSVLLHRFSGERTAKGWWRASGPYPLTQTHKYGLLNEPPRTPRRPCRRAPRRRAASDAEHAPGCALPV